MQVVGITLKTSLRNERSKSEIPPFFHKVLEEHKLDSIAGRLNANRLCVFQMEKDNPEFDYTMGVEVGSSSDGPEGFTHLLLPASSYVSVGIVKRGHDDVGKAFEFIFKEWIPNSIFIPTGQPAFIYYDKAFFDIYDRDGYGPLVDPCGI
jgi:predicted transcriptional regulator YdeE